MSLAYLPTQQITFRADRSNFSVEERTVTLIASDETPVERFSWERWETYELILSHDESHVDLQRVKNGVCLFFDGHPGGFFSNSTRIGKIKGARLEAKKLICDVKLNRSKEADRYLQDLEDGTEPGNSVGINVQKMQLVSKAKYEDAEEESEDEYDRPRRKIKQLARYKAIQWSLHELSAVDVPAIPSAGKYSEEDQAKFAALPKYPVEIIGDAEALSYFSIETFAKSGDLKVGDFVSWNSSGGKSQGKITQTESNGDISVPGATVTGTANDPAAKITVYDKVDDGYEASDTEVAHKFSTLTKIDPLKKPTKKGKNSMSEDKVTQLADENRELKIKLGNAEQTANELQLQLSKVTVENQYWQLRTEALKLWAVDNKLTQEEYKLDFSDDPKADLDRLHALPEDDAKIELKMLQRTLGRAALKNPSERLGEADKTLLGNPSIKSKAADVPNKTETLDDVNLQEKERQEKEAEEFLNTYKVKRV